jgi:hypothetical protein
LSRREDRDGQTTAQCGMRTILTECLR